MKAVTKIVTPTTWYQSVSKSVKSPLKNPNNSLKPNYSRTDEIRPELRFRLMMSKMTAVLMN